MTITSINYWECLRFILHCNSCVYFFHTITVNIVYTPPTKTNTPHTHTHTGITCTPGLLVFTDFNIMHNRRNWQLFGSNCTSESLLIAAAHRNRRRAGRRSSSRYSAEESNQDCSRVDFPTVRTTRWAENWDELEERAEEEEVERHVVDEDLMAESTEISSVSRCMWGLTRRHHILEEKKNPTSPLRPNDWPIWTEVD